MCSSELSTLGWHISPNGYNVISSNGTLSNNATINNALNTDIKEFGNPILVQEMKQTKTGKVVLQIQKIKNVSAPKAKENSSVAPRMLKLTLTDGHTSCQAIEISNINSLSLSNTPPGSKLLLNTAKISGNYILLHPQCCTFLGGQVPSFYDKWELTKQVSEQMRSSGEVDGPPPWVNFGEKIIQISSNQPFKSLASKEIKQDDFDIQRQDAINVVATGAVRKVFGGGSKTVPLVGSRKTYNNERGYKKRDFKEKNEVQKAPDKVSLFKFLEDKLQVNNAVNNDSRKHHVIQSKQSVDTRKDSINDSVQAVTRKLEETSLNSTSTWNWKKGDLCMAKYWEDNKYYNARVINLTDRTCVVQFNGYGNVEEVVLQDCIPINCDDNNKTYKNTGNYYKGSFNYKYKKNY